MPKARSLKKEPAKPRKAKSRAQVPPPDSEMWPPCCRGKNWDPAAAEQFEGCRQFCVYACYPPKSLQQRDHEAGLPALLLCVNHVDSPGELREVEPTDTCPRYKRRRVRTARWNRPRPQPEAVTDPPRYKPGDEVRCIPLTQGLFAIVDAADYEQLSKHTWSAARRGKHVYAATTINGETVLMHRLLMQPPPGHVVDHIDGNGLNHRRCNLRCCTRAQNQANMRPGNGSSRFVGVHRRGDKWEASIKHKGKWIYLGQYDDEVEAARARDRKAYEIHKGFALLNFFDEIER